MKLLPIALVALGGGLLYALYAKPRFLGDKLHVGDEALVTLSALQQSPEGAALAAIAPGASRLRVQVTGVGADTFDGSIVGFTTTLPNGVETSANLTPSAVRTFPKMAVTGISRGGKAITL